MIDDTATTQRNLLFSTFPEASAYLERRSMDADFRSAMRTVLRHEMFLPLPEVAALLNCDRRFCDAAVNTNLAPISTVVGGRVHVHSRRLFEWLEAIFFPDASDFEDVGDEDELQADAEHADEAEVKHAA